MAEAQGQQGTDVLARSVMSPESPCKRKAGIPDCLAGGTSTMGEPLVVVVWLAALLPLLYYVWRTWGLLRLRLQVGMNDTKFATDTFIELLRDARHTMMICDDGNDMPGSIYNTPAVIDAVTARLKANPSLRLLCLFSSADDTMFTKTFDGHAQVHMKRGVQPRRDIHFKIIDHGRRGYVSAHPLGSTERRYRLYDCSRTPDDIREAALGRHLHDMQSLFPQVEAAGA